jgi:hypothetical protein
MLKKYKNKVHKPKKTIVGGVEKDENISIMSIKDKLELLRKISNVPFIKSHFKNSPFDKEPDGNYNTLEKFLLNNTNNYDVALQIIKHILMCLYLGNDECYYYLEKYIRSNRPNIPLQYYEDNDIIFPNIGIYNIGDDNYQKYNNNVNLLFEGLKSKICEKILSGGSDMFNLFIINKYKYNAIFFLSKTLDDENPLTKENVELYVHNRYYDSVTDKTIKTKMIGYNDSKTGKINPNFKKVLNTNIIDIIKDINTKNTDNEDIIVIKENYKKELLNQDNLTGTMIIGFINSLYDTPSIHKEYVNILYENLVKFNTMFFINLFIENNINNNKLRDDTLEELLKNLRRCSIGFYTKKEKFIKLVKESIRNYNKIDENSYDNDTNLVKKVTNIDKKVDIKFLNVAGKILKKECKDDDNMKGIKQILFYSFMLYNDELNQNTFNSSFKSNDIIIQRLKSISRKQYFKEGEVNDCSTEITEIINSKSYIEEGFSLYTTESTNKLSTLPSKTNEEYILYKNEYIRIAENVKDIINQSGKSKYNTSISSYKTKYESVNPSDSDGLNEIDNLEIK